MSGNIRGVVIGLGNDFRCDDAVGLYVARRLEKLLPSDIKVVAGVADGTDLIELWHNKKFCIVIDSVLSGSNPGMIHRYDALTEKIPEDIFSAYSTHAFNISKTIKMAKLLQRLPDRLIIYGIEGAEFKAGQDMTGAVKSAADEIIEKILDEIKSI